MPAKFQLLARTGHPDFLDLPWDQPLADWEHERLVEVVRGIHRHVVRFVDYDGRIYALKELPERLARREYGLLRRLEEESVDVVDAVGVVLGRPEGMDAVLITRHLDFSLPYRALFGTRGISDLRSSLLDGLAQLLVRIHLVGFFWGDCSLSNTLFRRDAGALSAYLVDAETGEMHAKLSAGQREHDLMIAEENLMGELLDVEGEVGELPEEIDPAEVALALRGSYEGLWAELTREEVFGPNERFRIEDRLRRLNELGFDVEEIQLEAVPEGYRLRLDPRVVEPGHHARRLLMLAGLHAEENQARRMLNDLARYRAELERREGRPVPETVAAYRWRAEVFEPSVSAVPRELWNKLPAAEVFHEILQHRWFLSEQKGADVGLKEAVRRYVEDVLRHVPDERTLLEGDIVSSIEGLLEQAERDRYADALIVGCLALGEGDTLFVHAHPDHRELVVALAESAYRVGAALVDIRYLDPLVRAARVRHGSDEVLGPSTAWGRAILREHLKPTSAIAHIMGDGETGVFDDLPPERLAEDTMRPLRKVPWYLRAVKGERRRWAAIAWPTASWAGQVFPALGGPAAQRALADDLLSFCRLGPGDPPGHRGWEEHVDALARRAETLTALELERVELRGPGTELELRLSPRTRWLGGRELNAHGQVVSPNLPSEECFTSPQAGAAEGTFRCSRPLSFGGREIDGIAGEFRGGRLVRLEADREEDRDYLAAFLDTDPGARRLGEVALVDRASRIGRTGRTYFNTLLDENAAAHIAFGFGFDGARVVEPGKRAAGVNRSNLHLDVMIGTDELEATGIAAGGRRVPLIADGAWAV